MGLGACANLKNEMKTSMPEALPNHDGQVSLQADVVAVDAELSLFSVFSVIMSIKQLQTVGSSLMSFLTATYHPDTVCFLYETAGCPRIKAIEHRRRDARHTKKDDADGKVDGAAFLSIMTRLHEEYRDDPITRCQEIIQNMLGGRHQPLMLEPADVERVLSGAALTDDVAFATNVLLLVASRIAFTRAELTSAVIQSIGSHLDLFSHSTDESLASLAGLLCPEIGDVDTDVLLREMFTKLLATRGVRKNLRFFIASRIVHLHLDGPMAVKTIRMIGAPYVGVRDVGPNLNVGRIEQDLSGYAPDRSIKYTEPHWKVDLADPKMYKAATGPKAVLSDEDICDRVIHYEHQGEERMTNVLSASLPGEGEAKAAYIMHRYKGKRIVMVSRDSDTVIIMLLAAVPIMNSRKTAPDGTVDDIGKAYLDMGAVSRADNTPFLVDIYRLYERIVESGRAAVAHPVEMYCLRHILPGCDYFDNPYSLGPGAFTEGFEAFGPVLHDLVRRTRFGKQPWVMVDEELLWTFVRMIYAADVSMAMRVMSGPGYNPGKVARLAARTRRGIAVMNSLSDLKGSAPRHVLESVLALVPPHADVVQESVDAAVASLARKHSRSGEPIPPVMPHDVELKTFWTEPMIRSYVRRVHWTLNYFNSAGTGVVVDALETVDGVSVWGWCCDSESGEIATTDTIVGSSALEDWLKSHCGSA